MSVKPCRYKPPVPAKASTTCTCKNLHHLLLYNMHAWRCAELKVTVRDYSAGAASNPKKLVFIQGIET